MTDVYLAAISLVAAIVIVLAMSGVFGHFK